MGSALYALFGNYIMEMFPIAHCLVYVYSCLNPLIYNFMSGKLNLILLILKK
jgi:hypothetical protein